MGSRIALAERPMANNSKSLTTSEQSLDLINSSSDKENDTTGLLPFSAKAAGHRLKAVPPRFLPTVSDELQQESTGSPVYRPLSLSKQEIRLLCIQADDNVPRSGHNDSPSRRAPVSASLETVSLNDNPEYMALSYAWGSNTADERIFVDGVSLSLSCNLAAALHALNNMRDRCIYIWVDYLCINQDDLEEKAWQIHLMSTIYSRASKTLIWLGLKASISSRTLDIFASLDGLTEAQFLDEMSQIESDHAAVGNQQSGPDLIAKNLSSFRLYDEDHTQDLVSKWEHVRSILSLSWWGRRWVIQEAFFSKSPIVGLAITNPSVGTSSSPKRQTFTGIHMDKFAQLAIWHKAHVSRTPRAHAAIKALFSNCPFYELLQSWTDIRAGLSPHGDLLTWLALSNGFNQSLDRDMIFALLSLSSAHDQQCIIPDYRSSRDDLFRRVFTHLVQTCGLNRLRLFRLSSKPRDFALPSWCESYWPLSERRHLQPRISFKTTAGKPPFLACGNTQQHQLQALHRDNTTLLAVRGSRFDDIVFVIPFGFTTGRLSEATFRAAVKTCNSRLPGVREDPYRGSCGRLMALCLTLMANNTGITARHEWLRQFCVWLKGGGGAARQPPQLPITNSLTSAASGSGQRHIALNTDRPRNRCGSGWGHERQQRQQIRKRPDPFFKQSMLWCFNRALIITARGYVGLAPLNTEVGDVVSIFHGSAVPSVLRRHGGGGVYQFLGEIYVHGIMYGEAIGSGHLVETDYLIQ
ncbi:heterokaryon incompatibility protein-domain-containing protein [Apodospora peruviana]|uniref:Heterokaryon incompatibility protein-domain-containing protein n=1 Tax=Apodospora peruviana TaxID=516989 RepID=A0AAE0M8E8_9PEZI|nr:heterokaryon incompatibility protein-domain-containing protein [Apodospora peruviana]